MPVLVMGGNKKQGKKNLTAYEINTMSQKHHKQYKENFHLVDVDDAWGITIALWEHLSRLSQSIEQ